MHLGDGHTIICYRYASICRLPDPVLHFPFIEHTSSAVNNQTVARQILRKTYPRRMHQQTGELIFIQLKAEQNTKTYVVDSALMARSMASVW